VVSSGAGGLLQYCGQEANVRQKPKGKEDGWRAALTRRGLGGGHGVNYGVGWQVTMLGMGQMEAEEDEEAAGFFEWAVRG
jgi:hypothetical protein